MREITKQVGFFLTSNLFCDLDIAFGEEIMKDPGFFTSKLKLTKFRPWEK